MGLAGISRCRRTAVVVAGLAAAAVAVAGCSGSDANGEKSISVFKVSPGECFVPPKQVKAELTDVEKVSCTAPHTQEAYAVVTFRPPSGDSLTADYPGQDALKAFADGSCAQRFATYVGVDYQDSSLFFTYLLPSARSWQQAHDRSVICFITTTGGLLHKSVRGTKA